MSVRRVLAINTARKNHNTAIMLSKALEGARSVGATTELLHLQDYNVNGCKGCMACKKLKNVPPKTCLQRDDLTPILEKCVYNADSVIVGAPIYFWQPSGIFRSFSERLLYPYFIYGAPLGKNYFPRKDQKWGLIFTMGAPKSMIDDFTETKNGKDSMEPLAGAYKALTGNCETLKIYMTYHVKDFKGFQLDCLNDPERKVYHEQTWEKDLQKAYEMGKRLGKA